MTESLVKEEPVPTDVISSVSESTETKQAGGNSSAHVDCSSSTSNENGACSSPKTDKVVTATSPRRPPAPPATSPAAANVPGLSASSRGAKSKKKKNAGGLGGAAANGENTGRWTAEEHRLFLQGLEQHGKGWKKIASLIKSRTVVQIRTHAQKYFQKLAKARQNGEEGDISMEGRGGISTVTSAVASVGGPGSKRRRHLSGTKRKAIHSVIASAQREGKRIAAEQEKAGVPHPVPSLPAVSPILAHFVLPETENSGPLSNKSFLGSSTTTSQGTISGPALEDSIFRFLTPTSVNCSDSVVNEVARQAGANPITLPTDQPSSAPSLGGEVSPTGVADYSLYPSWTDGKDPPSWYAKGSDVEALLDVADTLDWLADPGDPNETYEPPSFEAQSGVNMESLDSEACIKSDPHYPKQQESDSSPEDEVMVDELPEVEETDDQVYHQLPSIFDGAPDSIEHLTEEKGITPSHSTVQLGDPVSHPEIDEPLFDTPMEEHDFVSTILENESSTDLPALE